MNTAMPSVLHLATATTWRGGEQQVAYLVRELAALDVAQHVLCAAGSPMAAHCANAGVAYSTYRPRASFDPWLARLLARTVRRDGCSLVHAHDSQAHTAAVLAASFFGLDIPLVVSRRVDFPVHSGFSAKFKYGHPAVRRMICVSDAIRDIMAPALKDPSVLRTIRSGIDPTRFAQGADGRLRRELGLDAQTPLVGVAAALAPHKDLHTFLAVASQLCSQGHPAHFVILGEGPMRRELVAARRAMDLTDAVSFMGFREDLDVLLPELDVFLITSRTEGLGTSILDAFACHVPVVATEAGGIPEIVHHEFSGLLCPVGDHLALAAAVQRVLGDPDLRHRLIAGGQEVLRAHHPRKVAEATLQEYREVSSEADAKRNSP